ncbi:PAS domain-containing protein [Halovenus sp. WSH3]|uniref:PAS domain-containing protein n=1 Tax=Halovenus carboxidivorans TaxID=2692199 RepID=A0A6B0T9A1_9EURY|nr:methyl-accepting chemotaxis protein [Halovenus carboxidivorans]MXR51932.1 PAS domain-containing protein [Halovenus carboxidivorans]
MFDLVQRLLGGDDSVSSSGDLKPEPDGGAVVERVPRSALEERYDDGVDGELLSDHRSQLSRTLRGEESPEEVAATAREQAAAGVDAGTYARSYELAVEAAVDRAFDELEAGASVAEARERAKSDIEHTMATLQRGLDSFDGTAVSVDEVVKAFPSSCILIGADHSVIAYTGRLMGLDDDHSEFLGKDCRETIAVATYSDKSRANTLADKVAENPRDAHEHWDVERTDEENPLVDFPVYRDTSVSKNKDGIETHIEFVAVPMFDDDGELKAVFELIEDRSEEVAREREMVELIEEVSATLDAIGDGNLGARVEYEDNGHIDSELVGLVDDVNTMATSFEELIQQVTAETSELGRSIGQLTDAAGQIDDKVDEQNSSLDQIAREIENISATMEEVAANASEVTEAAQRAKETTEEGVDASEDARTATTEVREATGELVETVEQLSEKMGEISEVVEIIGDIAEQTNMLALNANIEAARADKGGDGFAVVADEVKTLATETQQHADDIAARVEEIEAYAERTVEGAEQSHEHVDAAATEINEVLDSLQAIAREVDDAVTGITEVAEANDDQAARIEEVAATVEQVQNRADDVAETTDDVVRAAENQRQVASDLSDSVDELR